MADGVRSTQAFIGVLYQPPATAGVGVTQAFTEVLYSPASVPALQITQSFVEMLVAKTSVPLGVRATQTWLSILTSKTDAVSNISTPRSMIIT
jgi:hypothetical protein